MCTPAGVQTSSLTFGVFDGELAAAVSVTWGKCCRRARETALKNLIKFVGKHFGARNKKLSPAPIVKIKSMCYGAL